jgi:hypothetical protein
MRAAYIGESFSYKGNHSSRKREEAHCYVTGVSTSKISAGFIDEQRQEHEQEEHQK